jgi:predicted transcriptional regulator
MQQDELDSMIRVIENPVRRKIIKRLSQEPCYALQLSKELGLGQPLVAKHLGVMEDTGLVTSAMEASPNGPRRKRYSLAKGISITMDVGPNLFLQKGVELEGQLAAGRLSEGTGALRRRVHAAASAKHESERLSLLSGVLNDVDAKIEEIEYERAELLGVRNLAMHEAAQVANKFEARDTRRVLFHILDEHNREVDTISEALNLREFSVKTILDELEGYIQ